MPKDEGRAVDEAGEMAMRPHLGFSEGTDYYNTGKMGANWGTGIPIQVTPQLLQRGQQRFNINCMPCHGELAEGDGIVKQYGLATVVSLQDDRIRKMADGEIFNTITHGKNTMMAYGPRVTVHGSLGDHLLPARPATEPARERGRCAGRNIRRTWRKNRSRPNRDEEMSDRSHVLPAPEGEYFENGRFAGLSLHLRSDRRCRRHPELDRRLQVAGAIQLLLAFRVHFLLHPLHRLSFLDNRASRC